MEFAQFLEEVFAQAPALATVEKDSETERDLDLALLLELDIPAGEQGRPQSTEGSCCFGQLAVDVRIAG